MLDVKGSADKAMNVLIIGGVIIAAFLLYKLFAGAKKLSELPAKVVKQVKDDVKKSVGLADNAAAIITAWSKSPATNPFSPQYADRKAYAQSADVAANIHAAMQWGNSDEILKIFKTIRNRQALNDIAQKFAAKYQENLLKYLTDGLYHKTWINSIMASSLAFQAAELTKRLHDIQVFHAIILTVNKMK